MAGPGGDGYPGLVTHLNASSKLQVVVSRNVYFVPTGFCCRRVAQNVMGFGSSLLSLLLESQWSRFSTGAACAGKGPDPSDARRRMIEMRVRLLGIAIRAQLAVFLAAYEWDHGPEEAGIQLGDLLATTKVGVTADLVTILST